MRNPNTYIIAALCLVFAFLASSASKAGQALIKPDAVPMYQPKFHPFEEGERAVYRSSWNGIIAVASAEVHTTPTVIDGRKVYQVRVEARTSKVMDLIWKMRDTISSTFDARALSPSRFTFNQRENSKVIDTDARYDRATKRWSVNRRRVGKRAKVYTFDSPNTLDPITAVYLARSINFKIGDRLYFKIFGGRYQYLLELTIEGKEPVHLVSGQVVEAFRIIPRLQNLTKRGYSERLNEATIWISADERRLPIKISSKIVFGTVYLEIIDDKHGIEATSAEPHQPAS